MLRYPFITGSEIFTLSTNPRALPEPDAEALAHSRALSGRIRDDIERNGPMPFSRFMRYALYEPGYGYYMNPLRKFGAAGDFITAPESAPLFSRCLARYCETVLDGVPGAAVLELGAGDGAMAAAMLSEWLRRDTLPERYYILELSGQLRARQARALQALPAAVRERVEWLDRLEGFQFEGMVLANEVLDAMPFEVFQIDQGAPRAWCVDYRADKEGFCWQMVDPGPDLVGAVESIQADVGHRLPDGYCSECNPHLSAWLAAIADCLTRGAILAIDYGYPRREYYLPERSMGTLMCHYRHRAHADPLRYPGLQDITAHVDFTAVAEAAADCGLSVAGYTHQAGLLLDGGVETLLGELMQGDAAEQLYWSQQAKTLMLPGEMGERFKAIVLSKRYNTFPGFSHDQRHRL